MRDAFGFAAGALRRGAAIYPGEPGLGDTRRPAGILLVWQERANQRHALASLEDHMLNDIGLTRAEAQREMAKPFWVR
jgi:uncharacterized protein YjiS (DUF1127 family)